MRSKKYLVQFEFEPETRWLFEPDKTLKLLELVAENVATCHTAGPRPRVTVTLEETPEPVAELARA